MTTERKLQMGDLVEYQGDVWEVGFINNAMTGWAGTVRLQKGPTCYDKQVNHIYPSDLRLIKGAA